MRRCQPARVRRPRERAKRRYPGRAATRFALVALVLGAIQCGQAERYRAEGVVRSVDRAGASLVVDHGEIPGFMPAMTMRLGVAARSLLDPVESGQQISFVLEKRGRDFQIVELRVVAPGQSAGGEDTGIGIAEFAPAFSLIDQGGELVELEALRGKAVLLDFIYTRCPGPCPALTGLHVAVQRGLAAEGLAAGGEKGPIRFLSVSLDPASDTPQALRAYARERGVDLGNWSFLTGTPEEIREIAAAYAVATVGADEISLDHPLATYLIDGDGRVAERYLGLDPGAAERVVALKQLAAAAPGGG